MQHLTDASRISIHAPTRGATFSVPALAVIDDDFNPRSYKRSDVHAEDLDICDTISIHAPTRGATLNHTKAPAMLIISIHAPTRGATKIF